MKFHKFSEKNVSKNIGFLAEARLKLQDLNDIRKSGRYPIYRINGLKAAVKKIYHEAGRSVVDIGFENGKRIVTIQLRRLAQSNAKPNN